MIPGAPTAASRPRHRRLLRGLALLAGLGLLGYVVSRYPLAAIASSLAQIGAIWLVTPLIALLWQSANTRAFHTLVAHDVPFLLLLRAKLASDGYGTLLPFGTVAGEAVRMKLLAPRLPGGLSIGAVLADRALGDGVGLIYSSMAVLLLVFTFAPADPARAGLLTYAGVAAVGGVVLFGLLVTRFPGRIGAFVARRFGGGAVAIGDPPSATALVAAAGWQLVGRALGVAETALLLYRLDLPHDLVTCVCIHGGLGAAGYITFASPTGVGVMDAAAVIAFGLLGLPGEAAVAFALARRARILLVGAAGVAWHVATQPRDA